VATPDYSHQKDEYRRLRQLSCGELWTREVPAFDLASERERMKGVAVIRAVGVVFAESGSDEEKQGARLWLRQLLKDPQEKVRRYALNALPKLDSDETEESALLELMEKPASERERKALGSALEKIGGAETLARPDVLEARTSQKIQAKLARSAQPGSIRLEATVRDIHHLEIVLRCRHGLEVVLEEESKAVSQYFRHVRTSPGLVALRPVKPFRLADLFELRCFATAGFRLGLADDEQGLAGLIASKTSRSLMEILTDGPVRYRFAFAGQGHRRGAVRAVTDEVYRLCPALLNDPSQALWQIEVHREDPRFSVELMPQLRPDPRFAYRRQDVPAASHPPLAAAMAWLAGPMADEVVWDPFCGSGLELIECAVRGGMRRIIGTDRSAQAIEIAADNFAAALGQKGERIFACGDFRDQARLASLEAGSVSLLISNPPMGRRVPIPDLPGLIADLFEVAAGVLRPGGRLIFANPLSVRPSGKALRQEFRQKVDLGGFHVHVEKYRRQ